MDSKDLRELMEYISNSNFVEFELEREDFKLKLVKEGAHPPAGSAGNNAGPSGPHPTAAANTAPAPPAAAPTAAPTTAPAADIFQVTSPMVGTFYRSSNPTAPPFVEVGDIVKKGQVICIVEAMKLMNELESEVAGEVIDTPVSNGQPVEYGEVLFRIRATSA